MGGLFQQVVSRTAEPEAAAGEPGRLRVLSVCTGNICRSPVSEAVWHGWSAQVPGVQSTSAGVRAVVGAPMEPVPLSISRQWWGAAESFRGRQVDAEMLRLADLVLVMSNAQRHEVLRVQPAALHRTFLVRELDAILDAVAVGRASWMENGGGEDLVRRAQRILGRASQKRHLVGRVGDVPDPYRLPDERQDAILSELARMVNRIAGRLFGQ